ncbi:MAG: aldo/keto reductase [Janthinobacterium lividum]
MQTIELAGTGRRTTRLGFGCSSIMGGMGRKQSLVVLEWAFDAGLRHYDVAPMYGFGAAESCLGEFLKQHRGEVTVTTKFGIPATKNTAWINMARALARPLVKLAPVLKARAQRAANTVSAAPAERNLSPAEAERSLNHSLQQLRIERIDVFLLHDATPGEVRNDALLEFLERAKQAGKIGNFGVGTDRDHMTGILRDAPAYASVVQQEWSVFDPVESGGTFHIHHRSLAHNRTRLQEYLYQHAETAARWSAEVGADLRQPQVLSTLMMRAALLANPAGIVLFSSKSREHIQINAALAEPSGANLQAAALHCIVQREAGAIQGGPKS